MNLTTIWVTTSYVGVVSEPLLGVQDQFSHLSVIIYIVFCEFCLRGIRYTYRYRLLMDENFIFVRICAILVFHNPSSLSVFIPLQKLKNS
jgi:predicted branched-subunit amino acid permease